MFDRFTIHIKHEQRSVRRVRQLHWPKPVVRSSQEFGIGLCANGHPLNPLPDQLLAVHEVAPNVADEDVSSKEGWQQVTVIAGDARGTGKITSCSTATFDGARYESLDAQPRTHFSPGLNRAYPKHFSRRTISSNVDTRAADWLALIACRVILFENDLLTMIAVLTNKTSSKAVKCHSKLTAARDWNQLQVRRMDCEVTAADINGRLDAQ